MGGVAVHAEPAWRERSDFIIAAEIESEGTGIDREQLWARRVDDRHFELCCIPFFVYDLALGDVVETDPDYLVTGVSTASGRYVFRVHSKQFADQGGDLTGRLTEMGALLEWSSSTLLAVDARDLAHAQQVADLLQERENLGQLVYETGKTA